MLDEQRLDQISLSFREGWDAERRGDLDTAKRCYQQCISLDDQAVEAVDDGAVRVLFHAYLQLGMLLRAEGDYQKALQLVARARASPEDRWTALWLIGDCHAGMGEFQEAERAYREGLALTDDPQKKVWFSNFLSSLLAREESRLDEMRLLLEQAVELDPNYGETHYNLGVTLMQQGDEIRAQAHLERAVSLDPDYAIAHLKLGVVLREQGNYEAAHDHLARAVELDPNHALAHQEMGLLLLSQVPSSTDAEQRNRHVTACEDHLRRASALDPSDIWSRAFLVNLNWTCNRYRKAEEEGRKLIELFPDSSVAHWVLGSFLAATDRGRQQADILLKRAIELDSEDSEAYYRYGEALLRWDRFLEARSFLEKAHQLGHERALPLLRSYTPPEQDEAARS
jgi:tetratricopeptide (TPR) repeat protein